MRFCDTITKEKRREIMVRILGFGEIIWDVFPTKKHIGGAPFNFSAHAVKRGAQAYLVSSVGKDSLGKEALLMAKKYKIKTDYIGVVEKDTGACNVTLDDNAVPSYNLLINVAYDYINADAVVGKFDALYFGTLALRGENNRNEIRKLLQKRLTKEVFCDVNIRPPFYDEESVKICCENATIIKISDEEMGVVSELLFGEKTDGIVDFQVRLSRAYPNLKLVIVTAGSKGSCVYKTDTNNYFYLPSTPTKVVSTVGAGDSYSATFLVEYLKGNDILDCMKKASNVSAHVVSKRGAI